MLESNGLTSGSSTRAIEVFFSYAHEDEKLRDALAKHLSILQWQGVIQAWHDREIIAGTEWAGQINEHLDTADIILLLVSADFLASDYCYNIELSRAMERHAAQEARVIPIILRKVDWKYAPFGKLQALPKDAFPVTSWTNIDEAFTNVAEGIRRIVEELNGILSVAQEPQVMIPANLPRSGVVKFVGRAEVMPQLHKMLQQGERLAVSAIAAMGGAGKTELALQYALAYKQTYTGGICWLQARSDDVGTQLGGDVGTQLVRFRRLFLNLNPPDGMELADQVKYCWRNWPAGEVLLVFDDVTDYKALEAYLPPPTEPRFKVLMTTRRKLGRSIKLVGIGCAG